MLTEINSLIKNNSQAYWIMREYITLILLVTYKFFDLSKSNSEKTRILFYHINALSFAGTEKSLQIISKYLNKNKFEVFFMYPEIMTKDPGAMMRLKYIQDAGIQTISFTYSKKHKSPPYYVSGMSPSIFEVTKSLKIDCVFTADSGAASFPFTLIRKTKIILINIFGQPNIQKNIVHHFCISKEVANKIDRIVPENKISVVPIPLERIKSNFRENGSKVRESFAINSKSIVFGRIGRADDGIFDPIGIRAFQIIVKNNPDAHYIIMAPMPCLVKIVEQENIPNVHFINPSFDDEIIWGFHGAIDVLAHFRNDGESFGLNIAESMLAGNPIISHKSHIWNAHLEYLDDSFSRVSEKDDAEQYAKFMEEMIELKKSDKLGLLGDLAKKKAEELFLIENLIPKFEKIIEDAVK